MINKKETTKKGTRGGEGGGEEIENIRKSYEEIGGQRIIGIGRHKLGLEDIKMVGENDFFTNRRTQFLFQYMHFHLSHQKDKETKWKKVDQGER